MLSEEELPRDALTGLPGREFIEVLDPPFNVREAGRSWSVLMVDLHGLEAVLESHGRLVADQILQQTAYMLARHTKHSDEIILYEHALFALVLPRTNRSQAVNLALRLAGNLKKDEYPENARVPFNLGIAESSEDDRNLSALVERALKSLDASRAMGPGRIAAFPGSDASQGRPVFDYFVDRAEQLEFLRRALDSSLSDGLEAVAILGPPGTGKTRLALELDHYARFRGCLFGRESPLDTRFSDDPDILGAILRKLKKASGTGQPGASGPGDSVDGLISLSMTRPVVAVVDDLQSAGQEDLERIASLVRRGTGGRILLVLSARTPLPGPVSEWLDTLGLFTSLRRLDIPPLSPESSFDLVSLALGTTGMDRDRVEELINAAGGNPGNLVEIAANLDLFLSREPRKPAGAHQKASHPARMADLMAFRAESLGVELRRFLSAVSVIPWSFSEDEACFLLDADRAKISGLAAEACGCRLLEAVEKDDPSSAKPGGLFRFSGEAVRAFFEPAGCERRMLMTRLGDFHSASDCSSACRVRRSAYCYFHGLDPAMALDSILASADDAARRNAHREREEWLGLYVSTALEMTTPPQDFVQRCLDLGELARRHGRRTYAIERFRTAAAMSATPEESFQPLLLLGKCLIESGDFASAKGCFDRMEALPSPSPEVTMTSRVALAQLMHSTGHTKEAAGLLSDVEGWMEGGMEGLGSSRLRSEFLRVYGTILAADGDPSSGIGMCNEALEIAEKSGDAREQVKVLSALSWIMAPGGAWEERYRILKNAGSTARASGDMEGLAGVWAGLGSVHMSLNQVETAESFTEKAALLAEKVGCPALGVDSEIITGLAELHRGEKETALRRFSAALESANRLGDARSSLVCSMNAARILGSLGSHAQARALLESLDAVGVPARAGRRLHADLSFCKGVVEYQASAVEGPDTLNEALDHIRLARSLYSPNDSLADLEAAWFEARCLRDLGYGGESAALAEESCRRIGRLMDSVDSSFVREDFGQTDFIMGLLMLGCDAGAGVRRPPHTASRR